MRLRLTARAASMALSAFHAVTASALIAPPFHLATAARRAVDVAGRIVDRAGQPIVSATVTIPELSRATSCDLDGRIRFDAVPQGRYTVAVRRLRCVALARSIVGGDAPIDMSVTLDAGALVGKPMIRVLFGPRVLRLTDGSRVEDYSWSDEDGPSIDARLAQRIEVIRGPASVLYGSEALGGVVNVVPAELPFSADGSKLRRGALEAYGGSNNTELGAAAMMEGAQGRYGWRGLATGRFALDVQTPRGVLQNSSFFAVNGEGAFGIKSAHGNTTLRGGSRELVSIRMGSRSCRWCGQTPRARRSAWFHSFHWARAGR